jgi:hypothetical protein
MPEITEKIEKSPWSDHMNIAIKCWSQARARELSDKALKVSVRNHRYMEHFLAEVLTDALMTFNETYNKAYEQHVQQLERLLTDDYVTRISNPVILGSGPIPRP